MSIGIFYAFGVAAMAACVYTLQKYIAQRHPTHIALMVQYFFHILFIVGAIFLFDGFIPTGNIGWLLLLFLAGIIGYVGLRLLFKALRLLPVGIVLFVAYSYVCLGYFLNIFLFPAIEQLSLMRLLVGVSFFLLIGFLLVERSPTNKFEFDERLLFPLGTALCRTFFFTIANYVIKEGITTPLQTTFYLQGTIFLGCIIGYLLTGQGMRPLYSFVQRAWLPTLLRAGAISLLGFWTYVAYRYTPANIVNLIKLSSVLLSVFLGRMYLDEIITRKELIVTIGGLLLISIFLLI